MARKRAALNSEETRRVLGVDLVDRFLEAEGLREVDVIEVPISQIDPNPFQPRRDFDEEGLKELAQSVRAHGFFGHLVARPAGDRYQIAYGERRKWAAERAGVTHLPLAVRPLTDEQMVEIALTENVQRKDLNPLEEAEAYQRLVGLGFSLRQISERVGKSPGHISLLMSLLRHEDVAAAVREGRLGVREAHEIGKVESPEVRGLLTDRFGRGELDRESLQEAVRWAVEGKLPPRPVPAPTIPDPAMEAEPDPAPGGAAQAFPEPQGSPPGESYDPRPYLHSALKQLEKIPPHPLAHLEDPLRADVRLALKQMMTRLQSLLEQLGEEKTAEGVPRGGV